MRWPWLALSVSVWLAACGCGIRWTADLGPARPGVRPDSASRVDATTAETPAAAQDHSPRPDLTGPGRLGYLEHRGKLYPVEQVLSGNAADVPKGLRQPLYADRLLHATNW
ncbi:MAG: hypothetical protein FJ279_26710 [Planctomycetes bacterium]|nr:hypothetical protein [Planctomycetota bacterium]